MKRAILSIGSTVAGLAAAAVVSSHLVIGFFFGFIVTWILLVSQGFQAKELTAAAVGGIKRILPVVYILALISLLIPAWIESGTVPALIAGGMRVIDPLWLLPITFVITACTSFMLGTSIGTLSSLGIAIMGIAASAGANPALVAGALVSGAFFGDRTSPVSSAFHLVSNSTDSDSRSVFQAMLPTTLIVMVLCLIAYGIVGSRTSAHAIFGQQEMIRQLGSSFHLSWLSLIPIFVLFGVILLRGSTVRALLYSILSAGVIVLLQAPANGLHFIHSLWLGYSHPAGKPLSEILHGGGLAKMLELLVFISLAGAMNGILEHSKLLQPLIERLLKGVDSLIGFTARALFLAFLLSLVGCNQTFPILFTARAMVSPWQQAGFSNDQLGRVVADTALVIAGLIPWNMIAVLAGAAIGVPVITYLPYAFLLWLTPIVTLCISLWLQNRKHALPMVETFTGTR